MADETAELLVSIRADLSDLKAKFDEAKGAGEKFGRDAKGAFDELGKSIAQIFAVEKIKDFFAEGIRDFAELDKSITQTQFNLERFGAATGDSREEMKAWAQQIQETTLFTDNEAIATLNKFVTMTHSFTDSLKLSKLAMDVSAATGLELTQVQVGLGNAFEGNKQGLGRLLRNFPDLKKQIEEGGDAVAILQEQFGGFAEKIGQAGLVGDLFHLQEAWKDVAKDFAEENQGAIHDTIEGFKELAGVVKTALEYFLKFGQTLGVVYGNIAANILAAKDLVTGHFKEAMAEFKVNDQALVDGFKEIWEKGGETAAKKFVEGLDKGVLKSKPSIEKAVEETVDSVDTMLKDIIQKEHMTLTQAFAIFREGEVKLVKGIHETDTEFKKRVDSMKVAHKAAADEIKKTAEDLSQTIVKTSQNAASAMTKAYLEGTLSVAKGFEILGKAIFKSLVEAIAGALEQESVKNFIIATGMLANPLTAAGAPGFFATAGIEAAGAGAIMGVAEVALAEGGYVNAPTLALIGEKGPEKVTPLSGGHPMDQGGGKHEYHLHFPNVTRRSDFTSRDASTVARQLFTQQQDLKTRSGNRATSF